MSLAIPTKFVNVALTTSLTTVLYTAPKKILLTQILIANTSGSSVPVTITAGAGTGVADTVVPGTTMPANTPTIVSLNSILNAGDTICGGAGTGGVIGCSFCGITIE